VINAFAKSIATTILCAPCVAMAQADSDAVRGAVSPVSIPSLLSVVTSLLFVIGAIVLVGWLYSRMRGINVRASKAISILAAQPLGAKEKIVIVQIGDKQIAVGMTPSCLQTLHVFDKPIIESAEMESTIPFADKLRGALGRAGS